MMRLALLSALLLPAAVAATAPAGSATTPRRDWSATVTAAPGAPATAAWTVGNPAAKVKLVEWGSYTCPHCAHFAAESRAELEARMIRSGSTRFEVRHLIRDPLDLAAVLVARCGGPRGFLARHHAIFAAQPAWVEKGAAYAEANRDALNALARPVAFRRIADGAGLTALGRANGLTAAQLDACFAAPALDAATRLGDAPAEVRGTPSFYVDGRLVDGADWAALRPQLVAAGAR